ncbi:MAG: hypothetical protein WKG00_30340 [Polyangiaceae bacterium]
MRTIPMLCIVLSVLGCGPSATAVCDAKCDCEGCSDRDYDNCVDDIDDDLRRAEDRDCADDWDDLIACREDTGYCKDGDKFEDDCGHEKDRLKQCID